MNGKIINTKNRLFQAAYRLMKEKNPESITVSELCREAGVNRATFYKYYNLPQDVLTEHLQNFMNEYLANTLRSSKSISLYEMMLLMCRMILEKKELASLVVSSNNNLSSLMPEIFTNRAHNMANSSKQYFISGGVYGIIFQWMRQGYRESPEAIASLLTEYISLLG